MIYGSVCSGIEAATAAWHMGSPTECWTLNTSEFHSAAVARSLSGILETGDLPQRFFLSATACSGILARAARRGKKLPGHLEESLRAAAGASAPTKPQSTPRRQVPDGAHDRDWPS